MGKRNNYNFNLSKKAIKNIKMILYDPDYFIRGLTGISNHFIDEALDHPKDCEKELEYLSMLAELRILVESFQERKDLVKLHKRQVKPTLTDS